MQTHQTNHLLNIQAEFRIKKLPDVTFKTQKSAIPGVSMRAASQPTPLIRIPHPGDELMFEELPMQFLVDDTLRNWVSVFRWLQGLGFPDTSSQYAMLLGKGRSYPDEDIRSDITQILLDGEQNAFMEVRYKDCFPISLSNIDFDVTQEGPRYVTATTTFIYTDFDIVPLGTANG